MLAAMFAVVVVIPAWNKAVEWEVVGFATVVEVAVAADSGCCRTVKGKWW